MMLRREFMPAPEPGAPQPPTEVTDWQSYAVGEMRLGPRDAPVTIVEFSDFECPYCGRLYHVLADILSKHPQEVQLIYRNFPLDAIHSHAREAALAAQCAAFVGKFKEYHSLLFEHPDSLGKVPWTTFAARSGIQDGAAFEQCMTSKSAAAKLRADSLAADELHVRGTPTVVVNRWLLNEAPTNAVLEAVIDRELANARNNGVKSGG
jgi:protein-disulfide isomerase